MAKGKSARYRAQLRAKHRKARGMKTGAYRKRKAGGRCKKTTRK